MKIFNLTTGIFIGLVILISICSVAGYNIYLDKPAKDTYYMIDLKKYEVNKFYDLYRYSKNEISKEDYKNFLKNLDKDSQKEVKFIIDNSLMVLNAKDLGYTVVRPFTNRQSKEIKKFYNFVYSVKNVDKSTIQYGAYKFPVYNSTVHVLYNEYGMPKIKNKEYVKNKAVIDAGAYIGDSSVVLAGYTDNKVYAFEPIDENYENLIKTIGLNKMTNKIVPVQMALGDKKETKILYADKNQPDTANSRHGSKEYSVSATSVDDFVRENKIYVGIIKSDIEGEEMNLLKGAKQTIINQKPILLISIYHSGKDFFEIKKWIEELNLGYKFQIFRSKPDDILDETILIAEPEY